MRKLLLATALLGAAAFGAEAADSIDVELYDGKRIGPRVYYAVKFVCGRLPTDLHPGLVPGVYQTAINIHNPNTSRLQFRKKAVIANPQGQPPGQVSAFQTEVLEPNRALEVDCRNIRALFNIPPTVGFAQKGFVVIEGGPLDVVAVYTTGP